MDDFQNDQNRSELLQSPFNLTNRQNFENHIPNLNDENKPHETNENDLNYNDTFSTYDSSNGNNKQTNAKDQFILSDNNFTVTDRYVDRNDFEDTPEENQEEEPHDVLITVTILAAFPVEKDNDKEMTINESVNKPRATEGPKPINFYKFEYQLTPDDPESIYTADLVTYRSAVKLFPEKGEPRVIKAWEDENKLWVTWNINHELKVTKESLLKLFDHEVVLKIWDSKDFCSPRTKFDKPKPFKFSKSGQSSEDTTKISIIEQCEKYLKQIPVELHEKLERKLPNQKRPESVNELFDLTDRMTNTVIAVPVRSVTTPTIGNKLNELAADTELNKNVKSKYTESRIKSISKMSKVSSSDVSMNKTPRPGKLKEKSKRELAAELEFIKKNGVTRIKLRPKVLFGGYKYVMKRLENVISTVEDCFISINLESDLMSEQQLYSLNPLAIKIEKVTDLPEKPLNYEKLRELCDPTYCKYNFFNQNTHKTAAIAQDRDLYFNDTNVILAGLLNRDELHEFLHQAPFEIEVHDRDRKAVKTEPLKPCLFGNDAIDDQISSVNSVASKRTKYNPFETKDKRWDPYGVAKLDLYELVLGKKLLELFVPVLPCIAPDVLGRNATKISSNKKVLGIEDSPLSAGQYLASNTHLNVKITLAKPLFHNKLSKSQKMSLNNEKSCVFGRIILKIDSNNLGLIKSIIQTVREINANSLQFSEHSFEVQEAALSTYKLDENEQVSKTLDVITGFHLIDPKCNLFVLEGLKDAGVKAIYEKIPSDEHGCDVLYNSSMSFSQRLYSTLDVELMKIKLFEPLEQIVQKPLLYIRDMTPKISFDALIKLNQLFSEYRLRDVIRCDLLPSSQMILSMSKEFGIPLTENELKQYKSNEISHTVPENQIQMRENIQTMNNDYNDGHNVNVPHTSRIWTPIDNYNENFVAQKKEKETKNYISKNMQDIQEKSEQNKANKPVKHYIQADSAFNYSSQTLNSTELALNKFREYINQNSPKKLYTYNPEYHHSMTFVPVNIKKEEKEREDESRRRWKTTEGWIFPDVKTSMQCNEHPKKPDQASIDRLYEPWEENILHANKMKSPLDRTFFKYPYRHQDFDLWAKAKPENIFPVTIFEAGDTKDKLQKEILNEEKENWKSKVMVENNDVKVHKLLSSTEMKTTGFNSGNQIDRLQGLLKSEPKKRGLLHAGVNFNKIPALSVIKTEYEDPQTKFVNSKGFVAGSDAKLRITDDKNRIPVHYYDHDKFSRVKGKDFDFSGPVRSPVYRRSIELLKLNDEKNLNSKMYIIPNQDDFDLIEKLRSSYSTDKNSNVLI